MTARTFRMMVLVMLWLSLHRWDLLGPISYVGLDNWRSVLSDPGFGNSLLTTGAFIAIVVWAFSKRAKKGFKEASELPFADEEEAKRSGEQGKKK